MNFDETTPTMSQRLRAVAAPSHWFWIAISLGIALLTLAYCIR